MKIVLIAPSFYPKRGGVERHILEVARVLKHRNHNVIVLTRHHTDIPNRQVVEGVTALRLPKRDNAVMLSLWLICHLGVFWRASAIHTHDYYPLFFKRVFARLPWVHTFHGYEGFPLNPDAIASRQNVRRLTKYCIGVGQFIEKWYGTKLDYITYGAASKPAEVEPADDNWDIIYYGRFEPDTGFTDYIKGFELIHRTYPNARMLALGDGSEADWAKKYVAENNLPIEVRGFVDNTWPYLQSSKLAFTSGYLGILEAGLMGLSVIAHYATPIKEDYLDCHPMRQNFYVANNPEEVAKSYVTSLTGGEAKQLACKNWAEKQTWDTIVEHYEAAYKLREK